jgi:hypothetical protein
MGAALAMPILKYPCGQNPLALAGRKNCARTCTPYKWTLEIRTAARDVVPDSPDATIWRDSGARVPVRASTCSDTYALQLEFSTAPECYGLPYLAVHESRFLAVLTRTAARIECLSRAAPKRRHVLFSPSSRFAKTGCARSRQCTLCGWSLTFSDGHDP